MNLQNILTSILASELNETELDDSVIEQLTPDMIRSLYRLFKMHDLTYVFGAVLYKYGLLADDKMADEFHEESVLSFYRCESLKYEFERICKAFEDADIPYIPLKGAIMRSYYPDECMRMSCDIDILIRDEDAKQAINVLTLKDYVKGRRNYHDVSMFSSSDMHLELHFHILENMENIDKVLIRAWDYAVTTDTSKCSFTDGFFVFHMFAHAFYHFMSGGFGLRTLMDIWVMKAKMGLEYQCAENLLKEADIYKFSVEISRLADICFSGGEADSFSDDLLLFILNGGSYGSMQNRVIISQTKDHTSLFVYVLKRLFPTYKTMSAYYPVLKKLAVLLPVYWIKRIIDMLIKGRALRKMNEIKTVNDISNKNIDRMRNISTRLGL